jgi:hypothetical protein
MKNFISLAILLLACFSADAQTEKGTLLLGGSANFQSGGGVSVFGINPSIGTFIKKDLALGIDASLLSSDGSTVWAFGPYVKPYFAGSAKGSFFGKASFLVGSVTDSDTQVGFGLSAGYAVFLNKSVALEFAPGYSKVGKGTDGIFAINIGFQIHFKK